MRILHVLDHSLPLHSGYSFRTRALVEAQKRRGWDPVLLTTPRHTAGGLNPETVEGLTFHRSGAALPIPLIGETRATARAAADLIEEFQPDLVHCHSPVLTFMGARRPARQAGLPIVYEIRAFWEDAAVGNGTGAEGDFTALDPGDLGGLMQEPGAASAALRLPRAAGAAGFAAAARVANVGLTALGRWAA